MTSENFYHMTISRTTVDKLGIKMYDSASAVVAELIANSYDADANHVKIKIPLNKWLDLDASQRDENQSSLDGWTNTESAENNAAQPFEIIITDDGHGMTPDEVNSFFLKIGLDPRRDEQRGPFSKQKHRPRMGRKGIGKLAPFGICKTIEIRTVGGEQTPEGYLTAHIILNFDDINQEIDSPYNPEIGEDDQTYSSQKGTIIKLRDFNHRRTPDCDTFNRQIARRFRLAGMDFDITVEDTISHSTFTVGELPIDLLPGVRIELGNRPVIMADGTILPVSGYVAFAKDAYKNPEIAGIRIYARKKIVASTRDFNLNAGFTGEFKIRTYLVGIINADWLDDEDDLIRSDRQDILWASERGETLQQWGQEVLKELGNLSKAPVRQKNWQEFLARSNLEERARASYPDPKLFETAMTIGKIIGQLCDKDDLEDQVYVDKIGNLVLSVAPHKMIVDKLQEIGDLEIDRPLEVVADLFNDVKLAERASLGEIASDRIDAIQSLQTKMRNSPTEDEREFQKILENAPWLIDPRWTILSSNKGFEIFREQLESWYEKTYGEKILTTAMSEDKTKRPDFVMLDIGGKIEIIEIKKPGHKFENFEYDRLKTYIDRFEEFLILNPTIKKIFPSAHSILVCDEINLKNTHKDSYNLYYGQGKIEHKRWEEILFNAKKSHEDFLQCPR